MSSSREELESKIRVTSGQTRIQNMKKWMETFSCKDHHHCDPDDDDIFKSHIPGHCNACSLRPALEEQHCYTCDRDLCEHCNNVETGTCVLCAHKENFFILCSCGVDECYNYWGINPKLDTYFLCRRHKEPVADRCAERVKCSTCRNQVPFPFCEKCDPVIPSTVRCDTCRKWSLSNLEK